LNTGTLLEQTCNGLKTLNGWDERIERSKIDKGRDQKTLKDTSDFKIGLKKVK